MKTFISLPVATVLLAVGWSSAILAAALATVAFGANAGIELLSEWAQS